MIQGSFLSVLGFYASDSIMLNLAISAFGVLSFFFGFKFLSRKLNIGFAIVLCVYYAIGAIFFFNIEILITIAFIVIVGLLFFYTIKVDRELNNLPVPSPVRQPE